MRVASGGASKKSSDGPVGRGTHPSAGRDAPSVAAMDTAKCASGARRVVTTIEMATADDAPAVRDIYAPVVRETATSFEEAPPDVAEMRERIAATTEERPWLVARRDGRVVGYAYASRHADRPAYRWSVDVSAYVRESAHRTGVGRRLYDALLALLREQGYYNAYAVIALPNEASVGFHEAMGFDRVGVYDGVGYKLGAWHDVGHWHSRLAPLPDDPEPPTPVTALRGTDVWERVLGGE